MELTLFELHKKVKGPSNITHAYKIERERERENKKNNKKLLLLY